MRRADPEGEIYAACKTCELVSISVSLADMLPRYRRKSFVKHRGADDIEEGYVYGIASVVTPKQHLRE